MGRELAGRELAGVRATALPDGLDERATLALDAETALIAGGVAPPGTWALARQTARILRVGPDGVATAHAGGGETVLALARHGAVVYGLLLTLRGEGAGGRWRLLRSDDAGRSFRDAGPIPCASAARLAAAGPDEVWVLGAGALARTCDGGRSWRPVAAPGRRDPVAERLAVSPPYILLAGEGVRASADGGATWRTHLTGLTVTALDGIAFLATVDGRTRFGVATAEGPDWVRTFSDPLAPFRLRVEGDRARVLAQPDGPPHDGLLLLESADRGARWTVRRIPARAGEGSADLGPGGAWFAVDAARRLLRGAPA